MILLAAQQLHRRPTDSADNGRELGDCQIHGPALGPATRPAPIASSRLGLAGEPSKGRRCELGHGGRLRWPHRPDRRPGIRAVIRHGACLGRNETRRRSPSPCFLLACLPVCLPSSRPSESKPRRQPSGHRGRRRAEFRDCGRRGDKAKWLAVAHANIRQCLVVSASSSVPSSSVPRCQCTSVVSALRVGRRQHKLRIAK